jgi:hypothetical protein
MTIESAAEFVRLRYSDEPADYRRAAGEDAAPGVWTDVMRDYPDARFWVAQNKTVPVEILERLAVDVDPRVRHMVAMKRKLTPGILSVLASDEDETVRMRVVMNKKASEDIIERLTHDPSGHVRAAAIARLLRSPQCDAEHVASDTAGSILEHHQACPRPKAVR